jgi:hypothetical protein
MDSLGNFVKRIPVEIQDVRFKSEKNSADPARKSDDPARRQLGDPYPTTEGKPYGNSENNPAAKGAPGINSDLHAVDTGQVPGGA